jgi:hypothetical protein
MNCPQSGRSHFTAGSPPAQEGRHEKTLRCFGARHCHRDACFNRTRAVFRETELDRQFQRVRESVSHVQRLSRVDMRRPFQPNQHIARQRHNLFRQRRRERRCLLLSSHRRLVRAGEFAIKPSECRSAASVGSPIRLLPPRRPHRLASLPGRAAQTRGRGKYSSINFAATEQPRGCWYSFGAATPTRRGGNPCGKAAAVLHVSACRRCECPAGGA